MKHISPGGALKCNNGLVEAHFIIYTNVFVFNLNYFYSTGLLLVNGGRA